MSYERVDGPMEFLLIRQLSIILQLLTHWPKADCPQGVWQGAGAGISRSVPPLPAPIFSRDRHTNKDILPPPRGSEREPGSLAFRMEP